MATRSCRPHIVVLFVLCWGLLFHGGGSDLASDRAALLALRSAVGGRPLLWNATATTPCSWQGVNCSGGSVVELRLPGMGLSGQLPDGVIGNLTELHTLSLRYNSLSGSVPSDLSSLSNLRNLYLQHNMFSGEIPGFLYSMQRLVRLNLAANRFSGEISSNFGNLTRLATLYLEENQLNGSIPDLGLKLDQFNVSSNRLGGSIPSSLSGFPSSSFGGNSLCGEPLVSCNGTETGTTEKKKKKLSGGAIAGIVIGSVIGFLLILLLLICLCRRKKSDERDTEREKQVEAEAVPRGMPPAETHMAAASAAAAAVPAKAGGNKELVFFGKGAKGFDLEDLLRASAEVLGKGTYGTAYKATLENGMVVAVKRLKDVTVTEKEFREKIEVVGKMDHENLVLLRAYYFSRDEKLLVCDYMPMGSLSALLHGNTGAGRTPLNWETRSKIALGAARGIAYIHSQGLGNSHGNIKSSNILLTTSYEARVSDFGLAHLAGPTATPNRIAGYRAPEVTDARKVSQKADVYSFGVLLLEMLTGKAPTHAVLNDDGVDLPRWVQSVVKEEWTSEVFDLELLRYQNVEEEMVQLLQLAMDCTAQYPDNRPSMDDVARQVEEICRMSMQREQDTDDVTAL